MSSRDDILARIRARKPAATPLPEVPAFPRPEIDRLAHFQTVLESVGGQCLRVRDEAELPALVQATFADLREVGSAHPAVPGSVDLRGLSDPHDLAGLDLAIIPGRWGVAENAAIWLDETCLPQRALPFITQHLLITLPVTQLFWNLHEAYAQMAVQATGYGLWLSGPSKTADIEQSLVIGAHGARSLTVVLTGAA